MTENEATSQDETNRTKGLLIDLAAYIAAFGIAAFPFFWIDDLLVAGAVFTATGTLILFIVSIPFADVSIYDPYWSVAPVVILLMVLFKYRIWNVNTVLILIVMTIWSVRLTTNWWYTYKGLGHEDWRYRTFREKYPPVVFQLISFTGLHFIPTIVVYAGLVSGLLAVQQEAFAPFSVIGITIMLGAVALEYASDRAIHGFLRDHAGEKKTCNVSVWKYSRHPNYLGEMLFWTGLYVYFIFLCPGIWYMGLGFLTIIALFLLVSIPLMERHNMERRTDYDQYKRTTSMLVLLPTRKER